MHFHCFDVLMFENCEPFNRTFCNPAMTSQTKNRIVNSCINQAESALTPSFVHAWRAISGAWAKFSSFDAAHHSTVMLVMSLYVGQNCGKDLFMRLHGKAWKGEEIGKIEMCTCLWK